MAGAPVAAVLGGYAGRRLGFPAGVFTGAMVGVGLWLAALGFPSIRVPASLGQALQILVGILVGLRISRDALGSGARALLPAAVLAAGFLFSGLLAASAAVWLTGVTPTTAVFAAAPGGLTEMATIGVGLGADGPAVAAVHLSRLLLVILAANLFLARLRRNEGREDPPVRGHVAGARWNAETTAKLALIVGSGVAGGVLGLTLTALPAGGVIGALLGSGAARVSAPGAVPERAFGLLVQAAAGCIIGLGLSAEFFQALVQLAGVAVLVNATQMLAWAAAACLLVKVFRLDATTATFASAPGGMGTLLSVTGETDADLVAVAFIHLFRVVVTIVAVPLLVTSGVFAAP